MLSRKEAVIHPSPEVKADALKTIDDSFVFTNEYQSSEHWCGYIMFNGGFVTFQGNITKNIKDADLEKTDEIAIEPITYSVSNGVVKHSKELRYKVVITRKGDKLIEFDLDAQEVHFNSKSI